MKPLSSRVSFSLPYRAFIAIRSPGFAQSIRATLLADPHFLLVGTAIDLDTIGARLRRTRPEVLLLDLAFPELSPDGVRLLLAAGADPAIVGFLQAGVTVTDDWLERAGVRWTVDRDDPPERLPVVLLAAALERWRLLTAGSARGHGEMLAAERLTGREWEVLDLVRRGYPDVEIGRMLGVKRPTVRYHLSQLYGKLGVSSRSGAVTIALRIGFLQIDEGTAPGDAGSQDYFAIDSLSK